MTMDQPAIAVRNLSKNFGRRRAVDGLTFAVPSGSVCGFLGRNGSGKSTTIRMLMNLLTPGAGSADLLGLDCRNRHTELMQRVGYVSEIPVLYDWMKVRELIRFTAQFYAHWNQPAVDALVRRFDLDPNQKVRRLSRGMHAQLALALALGHDPQLLVLDEPATGLDVVVRRDFLESIIQVIQEEGRTVFFSSHLVHEVERVADHVIIIDRGRRVVSARLEDLKQEMRRLVVRGPGAQLPGVLHSVRDGSGTVLTVRDSNGSARRAVEAAGCEIVEELGLSLEEIFIDLVGAGCQGEAA
jgi:ABC-2 type transport system ATP-binding protein